MWSNKFIYVTKIFQHILNSVLKKNYLRIANISNTYDFDYILFYFLSNPKKIMSLK